MDIPPWKKNFYYKLDFSSNIEKTIYFHEKMFSSEKEHSSTR